MNLKSVCLGGVIIVELVPLYTRERDSERQKERRRERGESS